MKKFEHYFGIAVDKIFEKLEKRKVRKERNLTFREVSRELENMLIFCEKFTSENQVMSDNIPPNYELDEILQRDYPGDFRPEVLEGEQLYMDFDRPNPCEPAKPAGVTLEKRFRARIDYDRFDDIRATGMFVLDLDWEAILKIPQTQEERKIESGSTLCFYPQDFLHICSNLSGRGYGAIGATGFVYERLLDSSPQGTSSGLRQSFKCRMYKGIIAGRLKAMSRDDYRLYPSEKETFLNLSHKEKELQINQAYKDGECASKQEMNNHFRDFVNSNHFPDESWIIPRLV
ncbi:MAG: hypothetical protein Q8N99_05340 [Nanoarchaeota archaeon]|nr:hypothetical protein [Nanoarchaeota archaeon]